LAYQFFIEELGVTKEELVEKIIELLKTDFDLSFLLKLEKLKIETLLAAIRESMDNIDG
jgi:hypothetical protein